jgi:hypothetical protein
MAGSALKFVMLTIQGELGQTEMIEWIDGPLSKSMAFIAAFRLELGLMNIAVAGNAAQIKILVLDNLIFAKMTFLARDGRMLSLKRKFGFIMIEGKIGPVRRSVTGLAPVAI